MTVKKRGSISCIRGKCCTCKPSFRSWEDRVAHGTSSFSVSCRGMKRTACWKASSPMLTKAPLQRWPFKNKTTWNAAELRCAAGASANEAPGSSAKLTPAALQAGSPRFPDRPSKIWQAWRRLSALETMSPGFALRLHPHFREYPCGTCHTSAPLPGLQSPLCKPVGH